MSSSSRGERSSKHKRSRKVCLISKNESRKKKSFSFIPMAVQSEEKSIVNLNISSLFPLCFFFLSSAQCCLCFLELYVCAWLVSGLKNFSVEKKNPQKFSLLFRRFLESWRLKSRQQHTPARENQVRSDGRADEAIKWFKASKMALFELKLLSEGEFIHGNQSEKNRIQLVAIERKQQRVRLSPRLAD